MDKNSQLNITIDAELRKLIKQLSIKAGLTINEYVNNILKANINKNKLNTNNKNHLQRIEEIEEKIIHINKLLNKTIKSNHYNQTEALTEDDAKNYCILLAKQFKVIAKDKMISPKQAWIDFMKNDAAYKIKETHVTIIQDILREETILSLCELKNIIKEYNECPIITVFESMTIGMLISDLVDLSNKLTR